MKKLFLLLLVFIISCASDTPSESRSSSISDPHYEIVFTRKHPDTGAWQILKMHEDTSCEETLTFDTKVSSYNPAFSPDASKIIYSSRGIIVNPDYYFFVMNTDGSNRKKIFTCHTGNCTGARFSPDGSKILFYSYNSSINNTSKINVINSDGSGLKTLTSPSEFEAYPEYSPDGSKIVYVRYISSAPFSYIGIMNSDGSSKTLLIEKGSKPKFSPDGKKIIFIKDFNVYTMNTDGSSVTPLTTMGIVTEALYHPSGSRIYFLAIATTTDYNLLSIKLDGTDEQIHNNNHYQNTSFEFSPIKVE